MKAIHVKGLSGKKEQFAISVEADLTAEHLRDAIAARLDADPSTARLIFQTKRLDLSIPLSLIDNSPGSPVSFYGRALSTTAAPATESPAPSPTSYAPPTGYTAPPTSPAPATGYTAPPTSYAPPMGYTAPFTS
jgi:hypothetical protein